MVARETLEILEQGLYRNPAGEEVHIAPLLDCAISNSVHYSPDMLNEARECREMNTRTDEAQSELEIEVVNQKTLGAARRLSCGESRRSILCLSFASAKNPGGGFLGGSEAQEESLARSSGLYACISQMTEMYEANRACGTSLYTDNMIYSPGVPVFRDERGELLDSPHLVSIITAPAPNAGAVLVNEPHYIDKIEGTLLGRAEKVLSVAAIHGERNLILGAWGCGVFRRMLDTGDA